MITVMKNLKSDRKKLDFKNSILNVYLIIEKHIKG